MAEGDGFTGSVAVSDDGVRQLIRAFGANGDASAAHGNRSGSAHANLDAAHGGSYLHDTAHGIAYRSANDCADRHTGADTDAAP